MSYTIAPDGKSITCHTCGMTSHNSNDVEQRFCGKCAVFHPADVPASELTGMKLLAWVGEDELGSGEIGLKQAMVPAGFIPLVACKEGKIDTARIREQLQMQATVFRKVIRLVSFKFDSVVETLSP